MSSSRTAVVALLGVAATACASRGDVETMGDALRADMDVIVEGQRRMLAQMGEGLDSLQLASDRRDATGRGELERRLRRLEDLFEQQMEVQTQNNQLLADIYETLRQSGGPSPTTLGGFTPGGTGPGGAGSAANPDAQSPEDEAATQLYAMALEQFRDGLTRTARDVFENFLAVNGDHELAPDAQYWIGRSYEEDGDPGSALEAYRLVSQRHPDSSRAPAALFRRAKIEEARGNTAVARRLYIQIETGYPNSPEAPEARRELERLGG